MYKFNPIYNKVPSGPCLYGKTIKYTLEVSKEINIEDLEIIHTRAEDLAIKKELTNL